MGILSRFKVRTKLVVLWAFLAVVCFGLAWVAAGTLRSSQKDYASLLTKITPTNLKIGQLATSVRDFRYRAERIAYSKGQNELSQNIELIKHDRVAVENAVNSFRATAEPGKDLDYIAEFESAWKSQVLYVEEIIVNARMGKYLRSQEVLETTSSRQYNERILKVLNDWTRFADERNEELASTAPQTVQNAQMRVWIVAIAGIVLSFFAALLVASSIRRPLNRLNHAMHTLENGSVSSLMKGLMAVEKGDLTVAVHPSGDPIDGPASTEVGQLEISFNSMLAKVRAAVEAFNKTRVGLNTAVSLLQQNADHVAGTSKQLTRAAEETNAAAGEIIASLQNISKLSMDQNQTLEEAEKSREKIIEYVNSAANALQKLDLAVSQVHGSAQRQKNAAQLVSEAAKSGKDVVVERLLNLQQIEAELKRQAEQGAEMPEIELVDTGVVESQVINLGELAQKTNSIAMSAVYDSILKGQQGQYLGDFAERIRDVAELQLEVTQRLTHEVQSIRPKLEKAIQAIRNVVHPGVQSKQEVIKLTQDTEIAIKRIADCVETLHLATEEHHRALETVNSNIDSVKQSVSKAASPELLVNCSTSSQSLREFGRKAQGAATDIETQAKSIEEVGEVALTLTEKATELKSVANRFTVDPGAITYLTQPEDPFELAMAPPA